MLKAFTNRVLPLVLAIMMVVTLVPSLGGVAYADTTLSTDKTTYEVGEPIIVTCTTDDTTGGWIGVYDASATVTPEDHSTISYLWYYPQKDGATDTTDLLSVTSANWQNGFNGTFSAGEYKILYLDSGYNTLKQVNFTVEGAAVIPSTTVTTDKATYNVGEPIWVSCVSNDTSAGWVAIYPSNVTSYGTSMMWYYPDKTGTPKNILTITGPTGSEDLGEGYSGPPLPAGEYQAVYLDPGYNKIGEGAIFTVVEPDPTISTEEMNDMIWGNYAGPNVVTAGNKVFWGYVTSERKMGVACYDKETGTVTKNDLDTAIVKTTNPWGDFSAVSVGLTEDNRVVCVYALDSDAQKNIHFCISDEPLSIESFTTNVATKCKTYPNHCQFIENNGVYYIFYRANIKGSWAFIKSEDGGATWSPEPASGTEYGRVLEKNADNLYYCKFVPTTEPDLIRVLMSSDPSGENSEIRMGFFNTTDEKMYNADGTTSLGTVDVPWDSFSVLQDKEEGKTQQLLDVAVTAPDKPRFVYASFTAGQSDAVYYLYDSGKTYRLCDAGSALLDSNQLGASFRGTSDIVVARNADGKDYIEEYSFDGKTVSLKGTLYTHEVTEGSRAARPIVDINGEAFLWHEGTYTSTQSFNTAAKLMFFESEMTPELPEAKLSETSFIYNGEVQKPTVTVGSLVEGTDYTLTWSNENSTEVGDYTVTVTYTGEFTGEVVLQYSILPDPYADYNITINYEETFEEGQEVKTEYGVFPGACTQGYADGIKVTVSVPEDADNNIWLGFYDVVARPEDGAASAAWTYLKNGKDLVGKEFDLTKEWSIQSQDTVDGAGQRIIVLFADGGTDKIADVAYLYARPDHSDEEIRFNFDSTSSEVKLGTVYNGQVQVPNVLSAGGKAYPSKYIKAIRLSNEESKEPGIYEVYADFGYTMGGTATAKYEIIDPAIVKLSSETFTNNGQVQKPEVTIEGNSLFGIPYEEDLDYEVKYENANSKDDGTYKVTVNFIGSFTGSVEKTYTISHEHAWGEGEVTTAPTCKDAGVKTFTCSICGETKTEEVPATGEHTWNEGTVTTEPTCAAAGEKTFTCTVCGDTKTEVVPATGEHTWDEGTVTTEPTCEKAGVKTFKCTVCDETKTEEVAALGHDFKEVEGSAKEATCGAEGKKADQKCSRCDQVIPGEAIPATGEHKWDEGKVTKEATVDAEGEMTYTCTVCGETKTEAIDKLTPPTPVEPAAAANVTITVNVGGTLATANDGTPMADKEVTVEDINKDGKLSYDEALVATHAAYNSADGYAISEGWITKFWGEDGAVLVMMVNGAASMEDNAETMIVKEGDKLVAAVYKDTVGYNDMYAYFEEGNVSATYGDEVTLTLKGYGPFASAENAKPLAGATVKVAGGEELGTTDENGKVTFTLDAGTYTLTAEGTVKGTDFYGNEADCPIIAPSVAAEIAPKAVTPKVTLSKTAYAYTGKAKKPAATVKVDGNKLDKAEYTVTYKNNVNVGKATVTVTLKGNYTGTKKAYFKINPKGATILAPKAAKKAITVNWKAQKAKMKTKRITGYNVWVSTSKKFTKKTTVKKFVKGYTKTSYKVTKLKAKKLYYVKVRTYKKIGTKTYYSKWSKVKTIKTK